MGHSRASAKALTLHREMDASPRSRSRDARLHWHWCRHAASGPWPGLPLQPAPWAAPCRVPIEQVIPAQQHAAGALEGDQRRGRVTEHDGDERRGGTGGAAHAPQRNRADAVGGPPAGRRSNVVVRHRRAVVRAEAVTRPGAPAAGVHQSPKRLAGRGRTQRRARARRGPHVRGVQARQDELPHSHRQRAGSHLGVSLAGARDAGGGACVCGHVSRRLKVCRHAVLSRRQDCLSERAVDCPVRLAVTCSQKVAQRAVAGVGAHPLAHSSQQCLLRVGALPGRGRLRWSLQEGPTSELPPALDGSGAKATRRRDAASPIPVLLRVACLRRADGCNLPPCQRTRRRSARSPDALVPDKHVRRRA